MANGEWRICEFANGGIMFILHHFRLLPSAFFLRPSSFILTFLLNEILTRSCREAETSSSDAKASG